MLTEKTLKALQARDPDAIARVVREHSGDLLRAAFGMGLAEADAEELVQECFATFLEAAARFEGRSSVRTFLFGILYKKRLEAGRERSRELAVDPDDEVFERRFTPGGHWLKPPLGPDQEADVAEASTLIRDCLDRLPEPQRAAFRLREIDQEETAAVCNVLGVTDTHLRVLLFRARAKLRDCLESKWNAR